MVSMAMEEGAMASSSWNRGWKRGRLLVAALAVVALTALGAVGAPVAGQAEQRVVSGVVEQMASGRLMVATTTNVVTVEVRPDTRYEKEGPGTVADIQP